MVKRDITDIFNVRYTNEKEHNAGMWGGVLELIAIVKAKYGIEPVRIEIWRDENSWHYGVDMDSDEYKEHIVKKKKISKKEKESLR